MKFIFKKCSPYCLFKWQNGHFSHWLQTLSLQIFTILLEIIVLMSIWFCSPFYTAFSKVCHFSLKLLNYLLFLPSQQVILLLLLRTWISKKPWCALSTIIFTCPNLHLSLLCQLESTLLLGSLIFRFFSGELIVMDCTFVSPPLPKFICWNPSPYGMVLRSGALRK